MALYPRLRKGALAFGISALVVVTLFMGLFRAEKVAILTFWLIWLAIFIIFLIIVEFVRDRLEHESSLALLSNEEVDKLFKDRKGVNQANSSSIAKDDEHA